MVAIKSEAQVRNEAALYDTALREISRVTTMSLDTAENLKRANDIVKKQVPNLKFKRSKLLAMGLSNATFVSAVKAKTADDKSTRAFAEDLLKNPSSITKLNGASALGSRMAQSVDTDNALLQRVSDQLKQASTALKAKLKAHHSPHFETAMRINEPGLSSLNEASEWVILVSVALIFSPLLPVMVPLSAELVVGALFVQAVINVVTEDGRDKVAECLKQAQSDFESCDASANALPFGLNIAAEAACLTGYLLATAGCPFTD